MAVADAPTLLERLLDVLRWPWWTVTTARHRPAQLPAERPGSDDQWSAWRGPDGHPLPLDNAARQAIEREEGSPHG